MSFDLKSLINHKVSLKTSKSQQHRGYLICYDPITQAVVLYDDLQLTTLLIFHHAIKSITKIDNNPLFSCDNFKEFCDDFFSKTSRELTSAVDCQERRKAVLEKLSTSNVPVEEIDDVLVAAYSVCIYPPYTQSTCQSANLIVLDRIKGILSEMGDCN